MTHSSCRRRLGTTLLRLPAIVASAMVLAASAAVAGEVRVAVAANFLPALEALGPRFEAETGHHLVVSAGATGALYAQITQAAPFDVFLAADDERPARAIAEGFAVAESAFTYALGRLVLYSTTLDLTDGEAVLRTSPFLRIAVADPDAAPYGAAALAAIAAFGLTEELAPKIVTGESIAQAFLFVESGNAELGFVALSQVIDRDAASHWAVPAELHQPIRQDAVLLGRGASNAAAQTFLDYLRGDEAQRAIAAAGYALP